MTLLPLALLFLPLALGLPRLYPWARPEEVAHDPVLQHKSLYLNVGVLPGPDRRLLRDLDRLRVPPERGCPPAGPAQPTIAPSRWLQRLSGPGLALLFLTGTFSAIDWVMSLEPNWSSTIYGAMVIVGEALATLGDDDRRRRSCCPPTGRWPRWRRPDRLNDLGNLMLAFTMLWAYMSFCQYLIIWSGNLPEEIPWYLRRTRGGWQWVALALILFHFFLPFFVLLFRENKRQSRLLAAGGLPGPGDALGRPGLAGHPGLVRPGQPANPLGRAAARAWWRWSGSAASARPFFIGHLKGRPLVPLNDPNLIEALEHAGGDERGRLSAARRAGGRSEATATKTNPIGGAGPRHLRGRPGRRRSSWSRSSSAW